MRGILNTVCLTHAALASAVNDWQVADWVEPEPRLRASIVLPYENGDLAAAEAHRCGPNPAFVQILLLARTREPLGNRKYWKIYEAAVEILKRKVGYFGRCFEKYGVWNPIKNCSVSKICDAQRCKCRSLRHSNTF